MTVELTPEDYLDTIEALKKLQDAINAGGGLVGFTSLLDTTAPNNVVPVAVLMAFDGTSENDQVDVAIVPSGVLSSSTSVGAFSLQAPDGTNAGGNKRGISAVDLQLWRSGVTQVASGLSSFAAGSANIASNFGSVALGDANNSTGIRSVAIGELNISSSGASVAMGSANTASGDASFAIGRQNISSSTRSIAMGSQNNCSGTDALACGFFNTASGSYSAAMGFTCTADGVSSRANGSFGTTRGILYSEVFGAAPALGTFQRGHYCLSAITTNAAPLVLECGTNTTLAPQPPTAFNQVGLPNGANSANGAAYTFEGKCVAIDTATGDTIAWQFSGIIKQGASAASTVLVQHTLTLVHAEGALASSPAPALDFSADTTNGALQITAVGLASTNIQWMCDVQTSETTY